VKAWQLVVITIIVIGSYIGIVVLAFHRFLPTKDGAAIAAVVGALAGAAGAVLGAGLSAFVAVWSQSIESSRQLRDRVSSHAIELTRLDYDLRLRALQESKEPSDFLAPAKVYRELFRALLQLHEEDKWPANIEQMGLLRVFTFDPRAGQRLEDLKKRLDLLNEFLGKHASAFKALQGAGNTWDEQGRRERAVPIEEWVERHRSQFPPEIRQALTGLSQLAMSMISQPGLNLAQSPEGVKLSIMFLETLELYVASLRQNLGI